MLEKIGSALEVNKYKNKSYFELFLNHFQNELGKDVTII